LNHGGSFIRLGLEVQTGTNNSTAFLSPNSKIFHTQSIDAPNAITVTITISISLLLCLLVFVYYYYY